MAQIAITRLLPPIAAIVRQAPTTTLVRAYARAAREFCNLSRWYRKQVLGATVAGTTSYNLGSDTYEEIFGIRGMSYDDGSRWVPVSEGNTAAQDSSASQGTPELYQYLPHAQFLLWPPPADAYDLNVTAVVQPKLDVDSIDDSLLTNWADALEAGALYRLLRIKDQPWTDEAESGVQYQLFMRGVYAAQSDVASGFNAGAALTSAHGQPHNRLKQQRQAI